MKVSHLLEIKRWVLSYGPACRVLEPDTLRRELRRDLQRTLEQYGDMAEPFPVFPEDFD